MAVRKDLFSKKPTYQGTAFMSFGNERCPLYAYVAGSVRGRGRLATPSSPTAGPRPPPAGHPPRRRKSRKLPLVRRTAAVDSLRHSERAGGTRAVSVTLVGGTSDQFWV